MIPWMAAAMAGETDLDRDGVLEQVTVGDHTVLSKREGGVLSLVARDGGGERVLVATGGDRVALSPDGSTVAFVAPRDGIAAVWVVPFAGGAPRPVTPEPVRRKGAPPEGFVAPPADRSIRFVGERLCWTPPPNGLGPETCVEWR